MAIYVKSSMLWMLSDEESVMLEGDEDTGLELSTEEEYTKYKAYIREGHWILDSNNNVLLSEDEDKGVYLNSTELVDYIPNTCFFLLDSENNVILKDDNTGVLVNYKKPPTYKPTLAPVAIYSEPDGSLTFYCIEDDTKLPKEGDIYNGKIVTNLFDGVDIDVIIDENYYRPWHSIADSILSASFDESFADVKLISLFRMFHQCTNMTNIDLTYLDTSEVVTMRAMFYYCSSLTDVDVSKFNTSKVTSTFQMFARCNSLVNLDVSNFDTANVTDIGLMFGNCDNLTTIYSDDSVFVTTNVDTETTGMFSNSPSLVGGNGTKYDSSKVDRSMAHVDTSANPGYFTGKTAFTVYSDDDNSFTFYNDYIPTKGGVYNNKTVTNVYAGFTTTDYSEDNLPEWYEIAELVKSVSFDESFAKVKPLYTSYWFYGMINCTSIDTKNLDTSLVTDMHDMFSELESLEELNVNDLDVRNVTSMYGIFYDCSKLTTIDISNWQTDSLTDVHGMFDSCFGLTHIDLSSLNTSKVTDMRRLFYICESLQEVDVSTLDTSNVEDMSDMFWGCTSLTTIYSNDDVFVTTSVISGGGMFTNCTSLVGGNGTVYDSSHVTYSYAHVDTTSNPGYFTAK